MQRMMRLTILALLAVLLAGCVRPAGDTAQPTAMPTARAEASEDAMVLFATNVGKGDALILRAGDYACLIDAGKARAMGRVKAALAGMGISRLEGVFLTHTDDDHAGGLEWLAAGDMPVDNWYAPAMYTGVKEKKHPAALAAKARGQEVQWLQRGDSISLGDSGAVLRVLAPASLFEDKDDNNSLVMLLESAQGRMLLTGDMELPEEAELLAQGDDLACAVLKAPNHGDDDTTSRDFAEAVSAQVAVISTDSLEKPGTPDPGVVERLMAAGSQVVVTQDAGLGLRVTLRDGVAAVESVDIDAAPVSGISITRVDASDDIVVLENTSAEAIDLGGFYLHSSRGDELFPFPEGASIAPGSALTVGTNSTDGDFDLLWDDKKVINKKKGDTITLYDPYGRAVDSGDNGL